MSITKYKPHVYVIPEDEADRKLAGGFLLHEAIDERFAQVMRPAGGWQTVLEVFERDYIDLLRRFAGAHVVMLIDFDEKGDQRRDQFESRIPDDVKSRVFVIGSRDEPETLKRELKMPLEKIGRELAHECHQGDFKLWQHPHLIHNTAELLRLVEIVKPILFQ